MEKGREKRARARVSERGDFVTKSEGRVCIHMSMSTLSPPGVEDETNWSPTGDLLSLRHAQTQPTHNHHNSTRLLHAVARHHTPVTHLLLPRPQLSTDIHLAPHPPSAFPSTPLPTTHNEGLDSHTMSPGLINQLSPRLTQHHHPGTRARRAGTLL